LAIDIFNDEGGRETTLIRTLEDLKVAARARGSKTVAIAAAHEREVLLAARGAQEEGIARCILVGDVERIRALAADEGFRVTDAQLIHVPDPGEASRKVMELVSTGQADVAMKGRVETGDFLRAALDRQFGLRMGRLLSHVGVFEIPGFDRLIFISDAGVVVAPDLEQKMEIVRNAIEVARALGIERPRVAILAATEMVNPKIPNTMDAANLAKMAERGQITGGVVDGPLALDNAISVEAAAIKGINGEVAGHADILILPDIEAGNVLVKAITYFAKGRMAGVVQGARSPLIVASRADPHDSKLVSMALGILLAN
jgi:phosphate butyryltransferase